ncbi:MAG: RrF2 family transcriptional regulator [Dehalococcoidia bacterium]
MIIPIKIDYGVRTLIHLALSPGDEYIPTQDISTSQHVPAPFLLRICADLHKAGIIESKRGPSGGHKLIKSPEFISVKDVINAVDYSLAPFDCVDLPESCILSNDCSQQDLWSDVENLLLKHLSSVSIADLSTKKNKKPIKLNF